MSNFSFLEYSFNPYSINPEEIYGSLNRLGFVQRNLHASEQASMWTQNHCIILLRETPDIINPAVTGIGLVIDDDYIPSQDYYLDKQCGMLVTNDPNGFRILAMPEQHLVKMLAHGYQIVDKRQYETTGIEYFSGIVYNTTNSDVIDFYKGLGFKFTRSSDKYATLMSKNNRFTLLLNKTDNSNSVDVALADTNDVFRTTTHFTVAGFDTKQYNQNKDTLNFGTSLNHKIVGYDCLAFGNENSYTIENSIKEPIPNFDLVFRTRKQYLHFDGESMETHYGSTQ